MKLKLFLWMCVFFLLASSIFALDLSDNLLSYYRLENNSDYTRTYNLTLGSKARIVPAKFGDGLRLNGSIGGYASTTSYAIGRPSTWCAWFKPETTQGPYPYFFGRHFDTASKHFETPYVGATRLVGCSFYDCASVNTGGVSATKPLSVGGWNHVCYVFGSSNSKIYIDGELNVTTGVLLASCTQQTVLGNAQRLIGTSGGLNGTLDDVAIWNRALNDSAILELYTEGVSGLRTLYDILFDIYPNPDYQNQPNSTHYNYTYNGNTYNSTNIWWDDFQRSWNGSVWYNTTMGNDWTQISGSGYPTSARLENKSLVLERTTGDLVIEVEHNYSLDRIDRVDWSIDENNFVAVGALDPRIYLHLKNSVGGYVCSVLLSRQISEGKAFRLNDLGPSSVSMGYDGEASVSLRLDYDDETCNLYVNDSFVASDDWWYADPDGSGDIVLIKGYSVLARYDFDYFTFNMEGDKSYFMGKSLWDNESLDITVDLTNGSSYTSSYIPYGRVLEGLGHNITFGDYFLYRPSQAITGDKTFLNQTWHYQWAELYGANLTFNATLWNGTPLLNFTVTLTDENGLTKNLTTTTGSVYWLVDAGTYTATITPDYYSIETDNITVVGGVDQNHQFTVYEPNTVNLWFRDEETNQLVLTNTTYKFFSATHSLNGTTSTGHVNISLQVETYRIVYKPTGYEQRNYWITITNQTHINLTLYCINSTKGDLITFTVEDETGIELVNYYVKALRQFVNDGNWHIVEIGRTNYAGQTILNLEKFYAPYAFIVQNYDGSVSRYFSDSFIAADSVTFRINLQEDFIGSWVQSQYLTYTVIRSGTYGQNVTLIYSDTTNAMLKEMCMKVTRRGQVGTVLYDHCNSGSSGILNYNISATTGTYDVSFYYDTYGTHSIGILKKIEIFMDDLFASAGQQVIFYSIILIIVCATLIAISPVMAIVGSLGGLFLSMALGLNFAMTTVFAVFAIIAFIIMYKVKT